MSTKAISTATSAVEVGIVSLSLRAVKAVLCYSVSVTICECSKVIVTI